MFMSTIKEVLSLARPEILALRPYESARSLTTQGTVFLDANESPISPSVDIPFLNRYPEPQPRSLIERFSKLYKVSPSMILIGRGSDEAIDLIVRTFCEPKQDSVLICPPTYGMYEISSGIQGARIVRVPLLFESENGSKNIFIDEVGMQAALNKDKNIKIIFLCSPNNPTGTAFNLKSLLRICEISRERCIVVIDEAYAEFNENTSMLQNLLNFNNLIILRTLSKAWAMAGARCGVAIAHPSLIQLLQKILPPYPLSTPAIQAILHATDTAHQNGLQERVINNQTERDFLKAALSSLKEVKNIYPSATNFLLIRFQNSTHLFNFLKSNGIILRNRTNEPGLDGCIRITLGTPAENRLLLSKIKEAFL